MSSYNAERERVRWALDNERGVIKAELVLVCRQVGDILLSGQTLSVTLPLCLHASDQYPVSIIIHGSSHTLLLTHTYIQQWTQCVVLYSKGTMTARRQRKHSWEATNFIILSLSLYFASSGFELDLGCKTGGTDWGSPDFRFKTRILGSVGLLPHIANKPWVF